MLGFVVEMRAGPVLEVAVVFGEFGAALLFGECVVEVALIACTVGF
ncbi:hypothetical protein [Nocardia xishanensis]|nr:hypothetical protein [Nocardia xishanensis]